MILINALSFKFYNPLSFIKQINNQQHCVVKINYTNRYTWKQTLHYNKTVSSSVYILLLFNIKQTIKLLWVQNIAQINKLC